MLLCIPMCMRDLIDVNMCICLRVHMWFSICIRYVFEYLGVHNGAYACLFVFVRLSACGLICMIDEYA